jgi:hypothetical protein
MDDQTFRVTTIAGAVVLFLGLLGYSVLGFGRGQKAASKRAATQTRPPRVLHHDDDVDVYSRRNVRTGTQRGGGIRAGK